MVSHCVDCRHPDGLELDYNLFSEETGKLIHVYKKSGATSELQGVFHPGVSMDCAVEKGRAK